MTRDTKKYLAKPLNNIHMIKKLFIAQGELVCDEMVIDFITDPEENKKLWEETPLIDLHKVFKDMKNQNHTLFVKQFVDIMNAFSMDDRLTEEEKNCVYYLSLKDVIQNKNRMSHLYKVIEPIAIELNLIQGI